MKFFDHLSIKHKWLLLVCIPLLFELIIFGVLGFLLQEAEMQAVREARSRDIIQCTSTLTRSFADGASSLGLYWMTKNPTLMERYDGLIAQIDPTLRRLKELCAADAQQMAAIARIEESTMRATSLLNQLKESVGHGGFALGNMTMMEVRAEARQCVKNLTKELSEFEDKERGRGVIDPAKQERLRQILKLAVCVGAALTVLVAVGIAMLASSGIISRLQRLNENSVRLSKSQTLLPLTGGHDEIAQLDQVFHSMADALSAAHRVLALNEERLRSIVESVPVALVVTDGDVVESMNTAAREIFGNEIVGQGLLGVLSGQSIFLNDKGWLEHVENNRPQALETASGQSIFVETKTAHFETVNGMRTLVLLADVSQREKLLELRRHFVAMITHDLKAPLTAIRIFLESNLMGIYGELSDEATMRFRRSHKSVEQLIDLIMDLLDFEKSDAGLLEINPADTDLGVIVTQAIETMESLAESAGVELVVEQEEVDVCVDEKRLVRVIVNLLSNAIKFSPKHSTVKIQARLDDDTVDVHVIDQGPGIAAQLQSVVFDPYRHSTVAANPMGTGLGLANCKAIVEAHGGEIGVVSEVGAGADFWFRIPRRTTITVGSAIPVRVSQFDH